MSRTVRIGLLGCGTVGGGLVTLLGEQHGQILARHGVDLELARVLVRNPNRKRKGVDPALITTRIRSWRSSRRSRLGVSPRTRCR
jgi:homoserine dehydrogenase